MRTGKRGGSWSSGIVLGLGVGTVGGIAAGAVVGPLGIGVGFLVGVVVGLVAGRTLSREEAKRSARNRELDDIIGVTSGSLGAGNVSLTPHPAEADEIEGPSSEAWLSEWLTPTPAVAKAR